MSEGDGFKFTCPFCGQRIKAYSEHIGGVVSCPGCNEELSVPNPDTGFHHLEHTREGMWGFSQEEWMLLSGEDYEAVERIICYARQLWWECGAAAELLTARLKNLEATSAVPMETHYHEGTREDLVAFAYWARDATKEFCDILNFTYHVITSALQEAAVSNSFVPVIRFGDRIGREVNRAKAFHDGLFETSLPQEGPCPTMHQIIASWAPYLCQCLVEIAEQLRERANHQRDLDMRLGLHISLFPANMPQLFKLMDELASQ